MKTYQEWKGSLKNYLTIGDRVDDEMYYHFLNVMPPATNRSNLLQVGEPYSHVDGKATYTTFFHDGISWVYMGECFRGEKA